MVSPGVCAVNCPDVTSVWTTAVPLHVALPLLSVALVGGVLAPCPGAVMVSWVPLAIVFVPVNGTVAVAPITPLKLERSQVWPLLPVIVPPEVYVGVLVFDENVDWMPEEVEATNVSLVPKLNGPTVEVISQGAEGEQPGAVVLKASPQIEIGCPIVVQAIGGPLGQLLARAVCT